MDAAEALRRMDEITALYDREKVFEQGGRLFWRACCKKCGSLLVVWPFTEEAMKAMPQRTRCVCGVPWLLVCEA